MAGLKVAMSGTGGDELFGGYTSFRDIPRWLPITSALAHIPRLGDVVHRVNKTLALFRRQGILASQSGRLVIKDHARLARRIY